MNENKNQYARGHAMQMVICAYGSAFALLTEDKLFFTAKLFWNICKFIMFERSMK